MRAVVDRIEGEFAILEIEGITIDFPVSLLPADTREGHVFSLSLERVQTPVPTEDERPDEILDIQL
ncbi:MAG: DUF3006 domain-containing protein [Deltaproteobacteria bacterium]|nr:MAG: DUF3006 domain-containing protein [Deltaproteobacteria bacterium]